ncbi:unnamed protein product [Gordionus sp. m RMFG-2023]
MGFRENDSKLLAAKKSIFRRESHSSLISTKFKSYNIPGTIVLIWGITMMLITSPVYAHIRLTYPPARSYQFDFLDNVRTSGPCGIPTKIGPTTNILPGSTFDITWHLGYPHKGGFRIELINSKDEVIMVLAPNSSNITFAETGDATVQKQQVTIPSILTCENCFIRLLRQAKEWSAGSNGYLFWSCADVNIMPGLDPCKPNGVSRYGNCECNKNFMGIFCENQNDCDTDADCNNNGKCIDINATTFPTKVCFCKWGFLDKDCSRKSSIDSWDFDPILYNVRDLATQPGSEYKLYWRILNESNEIEMVLQANSTNWLGIGWRPNNLRSKCQHYPINLERGGNPIYPKLINYPAYDIPVSENRPSSEPNKNRPLPEIAKLGEDEQLLETRFPLTPLREGEEVPADKNITLRNTPLSEGEPSISEPIPKIGNNIVPKSEIAATKNLPTSEGKPLPEGELVSTKMSERNKASIGEPIPKPEGEATAKTHLLPLNTPKLEPPQSETVRAAIQNDKDIRKNFNTIPKSFTIINSTNNTLYLIPSHRKKRQLSDTSTTLSFVTFPTTLISAFITSSSLTMGPNKKVLDIARIMTAIKSKDPVGDKNLGTVPISESINNGNNILRANNKRTTPKQINSKYYFLFTTVNNTRVKIITTPPPLINTSGIPIPLSEGDSDNLQKFNFGSANVTAYTNKQTSDLIVLTKLNSAIPSSETSPAVSVAEVIPKAEAKPETISEPINKNAPGISVAEVIPKAEAKPETISEPISEKAIPQSESILSKTPPVKNIPVSEEDLDNIATKGNPIHPMDCMDMVIGMARDYYFRIDDYYSRDRSTPMLDTVFGGRNDITGAMGYEKDGQTTILFRKKLKSSDLADHSIIDDLMHVSWAKGQNIKAPYHNPHSGIEQGSANDKMFYRDDELKYHGTNGNQRGSQTFNFYDKLPSIKSPTSVILPSHVPLNGSSSSSLNASSNINKCDITEWKYPKDCVEDECVYKATWIYEPETDKIAFTIKSKASITKWTGIGFSKGRVMPNSDVIFGWVTAEGKVVVFDGWAEGKREPIKDVQQDLSDIEGGYANNTITLKFKRKRNTGDLIHDIQFTDSQCNYIFFPYSAGEWKEDNAITKHESNPFVTAEPICVRNCLSSLNKTDTPNLVTTTNNLSDKTGAAFNMSFISPMDWNENLVDPRNPDYQLLANRIRVNVRDSLKQIPEFRDFQVTKLSKGSIMVDSKFAILGDNPETAKKIKETLIMSASKGRIGDIEVAPSSLNFNSIGCYAQENFYNSGDKFYLSNPAYDVCHSCVCQTNQSSTCERAPCPSPMDIIRSLNPPSSTFDDISNNKNPNSAPSTGISSNKMKILAICSLALVLIFINLILLSSRCYRNYRDSRKRWLDQEYLEEFKSVANIYNINTSYAKHIADSSTRPHDIKESSIIFNERL